jgi:cysteinyl-tRNA synthetase
MAEVRFYNTLGRRLETFEAAGDGPVGLYTCGPTVYGRAHIGNLRTFLFEDLLRRSLELFGYRVHHVMNLTDVDDKVIKGAAEAGVPLDDFTEPFIEAFHRDLETLNVEPAHDYPRATRHVAEMIGLVERLVERGYAYEKDGSVFFRIARDEDYGRLSRIDLAQVRRGERVADDDYGKEDVRDFVLWKGAKPGEPSWDSPWGPGRPGWHLECSAMSMRYLGQSFDIHCGGVDNMFPHHENEIAQSESATGRPFVRYWLHSEHLIVDGEKMSKSLGNVYSLDDLLERGSDPRALRYLFLSVHYRQKLNFTFEALDAAANALRRLDEMRFRLDHAVEAEGAEPTLAAAAGDMEREFRAALASDLNISAALAALFGLVRRVNVAVEAGPLAPGERRTVLEALARVDRVLGVLDPEPWKRWRTAVAPAGPSEDGSRADDGEIEQLVAARDRARAARDFATADGLRDRLAELDVVIEDTPEGTRWRRR